MSGMSGILLLLPVLIPVLAGLFLLFIGKRFGSRRTLITFYLFFLAAHAGCVFLVVLRGAGRAEGELFTIWPFVNGLYLAFHTDWLSLLFASFMAVVWFLIGVYAVEYMKHEKREESFFAWYLAAGGILTGLALSANMLTFYLFYEMMTLSTLPLVVHTRTREAIQAGLKYLFYSMGGAFAGLFGIIYLHAHGISLNFNGEGFAAASELAMTSPVFTGVIFAMILGYGIKAGMFPFHGWLPTAHPVAPAPASAVLSGVITKAGILALVRLIYFIVGADNIRGTWVQTVWLCLAMFTVFMGSMMAYKEPVMKKRFAYSSVSQLSYIMIGLSLLNRIGLVGALAHVVFHSLIKNLLFGVAGAIIYKTGHTRVEELTGIGKEMPVTIWCFTFAALGLVGIPPLAGFVSKWYLAMGSLSAGMGALGILAPVILLISALLTAGYLLPITIHGFLPGKDFDYGNLERREPSLWMTVPMVLLAAGIIAFGVWPGGLISLLYGISQSIL